MCVCKFEFSNKIMHTAERKRTRQNIAYLATAVLVLLNFGHVACKVTLGRAAADQAAAKAVHSVVGQRHLLRAHTTRGQQRAVADQHGRAVLGGERRKLTAIATALRAELGQAEIPLALLLLCSRALDTHVPFALLAAVRHNSLVVVLNRVGCVTQHTRVVGSTQFLVCVCVCAKIRRRNKNKNKKEKETHRIKSDVGRRHRHTLLRMRHVGHGLHHVVDRDAHMDMCERLGRSRSRGRSC